MEQNIEQMKMMCQILEINYIKSFGRTVENDNSDIFPRDWFSSINYDLKIDILAQAIDQEQKIIDISLYQEMIEGVREK